MKNYEERVIEFEGARNKAFDEYFNARPRVKKGTHEQKIFEAGFRMAWELLKDKQAV